ncbi:MAG TPA: DUF3618 domain-containing protein [Nocardioides sp.]|nr:DUF3618 domain-containing protein [Nocardioides sp.]
MSQPTPEQMEAEIAAQRAELARTVDQLAGKLDVRSRAQHQAAGLRDRATTDSGSPRPEVLAAGASLLAMVVVLVWWRHRS